MYHAQILSDGKKVADVTLNVSSVEASATPKIKSSDAAIRDTLEFSLIDAPLDYAGKLLRGHTASSLDFALRQWNLGDVYEIKIVKGEKLVKPMSRVPGF